MGKNIENAYELLEEMATNAYQWPSEHNTTKKTLGVHELDVLTTPSYITVKANEFINGLSKCD